MKRKAVVLALFVLALVSFWLLEFGAGGEPALVEEPSGVAQEGAQGRSGSDSVHEEGSGASRAPLEAQAEGQGEAGREPLETEFIGVIAGRVVDQLSEPLAGIPLLLYRSSDLKVDGSATPVAMRVESDSQGKFRMEGLELGRYRLRVFAEGWEQMGLIIWLSAAEPKRLGLFWRLRKGRSLDGVVVGADGQPIARAWVVASWRRNWFGGVYWPEARSDSQGRFSFASLPRGEIFIQAWAKGKVLGVADGGSAGGGSADGGSADGGSGRTEPLRVELPDASDCKVTFSIAEPAVAGTRKPSDVSVRIYWSPGRVVRPLPSPIRRIRVPAEGEESTLGLRAGKYRLMPESKEVSLERSPRSVTLSPQDPEIKIELGWAPHQGLHGRLISKSGQGVPGIRLEASSDMSIQEHVAKSDQEGRFRFPRVFKPGARPWVYIKSPGYLFEKGGFRSENVSGMAGDAENLFTVTSVPRLSGRVVDERGRPVAGAKVWLRHEDSSYRSFGRTSSDEEGQFEMSLTQYDTRPLFLDARLGTWICAKPLLLEPQVRRSKEGIELRLMEGGSIEGQVVDEQGAGVAGAKVTATWIRQTPRETVRGSTVYGNEKERSALSDDQGRFRILGLEKGTWELSAWIAGYWKKGSNPRVALSRGGRKKGVLLLFERGGELTVLAPAIPKKRRSQWKFLLTKIDVVSASEGGEDATAWQREAKLELGKPIRILGLRPGRYRLQAADFVQVSSYKRKTVPGVSYHNEILIQLGTKERIKIP